MRTKIFLTLTIGLSLTGVAQDLETAPAKIDVLHYETEIEIEPERSFLTGETRIQFTVLDSTLALPFTLNKQLTILSVEDEEQNEFSLRADDFSKDRIRVQADRVMREGETKTLTFRYEGLLEREQYAFLDVPSSQQAVIDENGAVLLTEGHWFPTSDLPIDPATSVVRVKVPLGFTVASTGKLEPVETVGISEIFTWRSDEPITSTPVLVDRYFRQTFDSTPIPVVFFVSEDFAGDVQPLVDEIGKLLAFFRDLYGSYPIEEMVFAEVRNVELGSTGSRGFEMLEPALLEAKSVPVMELGRRIASQWWGYSVRMARPYDAWLKDGFATFSTLLYFKDKDPEAYKAELAKQAVQALKYQDTSPVISGLNLEIGSPQYDSIVASKGAWILYMLGQVIGEDKLKTALVEFYDEYAGSAASTTDFSKFINRKTGQDYGWFFLQWVETVGVPNFQLEYSVYKLKDGSFKTRGQIRQDMELFRMPMDVLIETKGKPEEKQLVVNGQNTSFEFDTETLPVRLRIDPNGKILMDSEEMRVAVHIALGDEYREKGEFITAIEEYEKATALNARSSLAHFRLGETFFMQHSYSNAANSLRDSLNGDLKPEWVETWVHIYMGKVYDILGQRERAKAEYQKAINSKIDYNGAQSEAERYLEEPFTKPDTVIG